MGLKIFLVGASRLLLLDVEHYDLTAWIFWVSLVSLVSSISSLIITIISLKILAQTRGIPKKNGKKNKQANPKEKSAKVKTEYCEEYQFLGFLKEKVKQLGDRNFLVPNNCLQCSATMKCLGITKKRVRKLLIGGVIIFTIFGMCDSSLVLADERDVLIAEASLTVFGEHEWVHVRVGGDQAGSVAWEGYGNDVQLVFYAYNDSGLSFDQFVIEANISYSDPFSKFQVYWNGTVSGEDRLLLKFYSFLGQTTTLVESFSGEVPHYGRPGTRFKKSVITRENEIFDVFGLNDVHVCSFEWRYISLGGNVTNATNVESIPNLVVYSPNGEKHDSKVLSGTMLPLIEFWDRVGFMVDTIGLDYVKWILYSDEPLQVRLTQGFEDKSLPYFRVEPVSLRVEPNQLVTVSFVLPEGVSDYEASWTSRSVWEHITLVSDEPLSDGEHEVVFKFLESARNKRFTLEVSCNKYGTSYSGSAMVDVVSPVWESIVAGAIVFSICVVALVFGLIFILRRRREEPSAVEVTAEMLRQ